MITFGDFLDFADDYNYLVSIMPAGWFVSGVFLFNEGLCFSCLAEDFMPDDVKIFSKKNLVSLPAWEIIDLVEEMSGGDMDSMRNMELYIHSPWFIQQAESIDLHGDMQLIDIHPKAQG